MIIDAPVLSTAVPAILLGFPTKRTEDELHVRRRSYMNPNGMNNVDATDLVSPVDEDNVMKLVSY